MLTTNNSTAATTYILKSETKGRRRKSKITQELKDNIINCYLENSKLSQRKIAEKCGTSQTTVCITLREYKAFKEGSNSESDNDTKTNEPTVSKETTIPTITADSVYSKTQLLKFVESRCNTVYKMSNKLKVGMIKDRHDIPINKFIFNEAFDQDLMFDYGKQEKIVEEFIKNNIRFVNGIPEKPLAVYATGLQCALVSIIKVCYKMHINLDVLHYKTNTLAGYNYETQKVITEYVSLSDGDDERIESQLGVLKFTKVLYSENRLYFYNCKESDFIDYKDGDEVFLINFNIGTRTLTNAKHIICKSCEDLLACYAMIYPAIKNISEFEEIALVANSCTLKNNASGIEYGNCIARI